MIIHVVPEKWYKEYIPAGEKLPVYQNPGSPFWKNGNFINIRNSRSIDPNRGIPLDGDNILKLQFDDVRELPAVRRLPFDKIMAGHIIEFVLGCDPSTPLFINCSAGISRSGAVGDVLNRFANTILTDNCADFQAFYRNNPQIDPNPLVREILNNVIDSHLQKNKKEELGIRAFAFAFLILFFVGTTGYNS